MKKIIALLPFVWVAITSSAQTTWTEADRKYLLDNLTRSRDELISETKGLTKAQWSFKESPDRWSINQIVEHIAIWEMLLSHDISRAYNAGIKPERINSAAPDSTFVRFIYETTPHYSLEYTKPFSYTIPMGINPLANNLAWFLKMRNESIGFVKTTPDDLRAYFRSTTGSIHQVYIYVFGHTDRHIRQIKKVTKDPAFPK
ncbi:MAG: DinB family protein [Cyclobacteriaceae bacterium]|nr:DinB family protein [Cyclobacteriaceae bacterium]